MRMHTSNSERTRTRHGITAALAVLLTAGPALAQSGRTDTIAQSGQTVPGTSGSFVDFDDVLLNDAGHLGFIGTRDFDNDGQVDDQGIYRVSGDGLIGIARTSDPVSGENFTNFRYPALNEAGQAAFQAFIDTDGDGSVDEIGIYRGSGGGLTEIARVGDPVSGGNFGDFSKPVLNNAGQVAFLGKFDTSGDGFPDERNIYRGSGGALTEIAREGDTVHGGNLSLIYSPVFNDAGQAAFDGFVDSDGNGSTVSEGVYLGSGGALTEIADDATTFRGGVFEGNFNAESLNDAGQAAFKASIDTDGDGLSNGRNLYRGSGDGLTEIAREGDTVRGGNLLNFVNPVLNNAGQVAFTGRIDTDGDGYRDESGIYRGSGGALTEIAYDGQPAPNGSRRFSAFGLPALSEGGQVAFKTALTGVNNEGVYIGDGEQLLRVARAGETLAGGTVDEVDLATGEDESNGINRFGQVAYTVELDDGRELVRLFTPDVRFRRSFDGDWDNAGNWTLSLDPGRVHDVTIDANVTVDGPTSDATVRTLSVGENFASATLNLQPGGVLDSQQGIEFTSTATLSGEGKLGGAVTSAGRTTPTNVVLQDGLTQTPTGLTTIADDERLTVLGTFDNQGEVQLGGAAATLAGGTVDNRGLIAGEGRVNAVLNNQAGGRVRIETGQRMVFTAPGTAGPGPANTNAGQINITGGGRAEFFGGLENDGDLTVSSGGGDVFGRLVNNSAGDISVANSSTAEFFGNLTNDGDVTVTTGSKAVFLGQVDGSGDYPGSGTVEFAGGYSPGNSPAINSIGGDVTLSDLLEIEIGGLTPGEGPSGDTNNGYDQVQIAGDLTLSDALNITLLDDFELSDNQSFEIIDLDGTRDGMFDGLGEGDSVGTFGDDNQNLFISYAAGDGNDIALSTVPEPTTLALLGLGGLGLLGDRRRSIRA